MALTAGHYKARALEADFGFAGTGTKQVAVAFEITDGEEKGERITWYSFFTPACVERTLDGMRAAGCTFPNDEVHDLTGLGDVEVELVLIEEEDEHGRLQVRVRWVNRIGGGVALATRMTEADKRSFAAEMRGYVLQSRQKSGGAAAAPAGAKPAPAARTASAPTSGRAAPRPATNGKPGERRSMNGTDDLPY